MLWIPGGERRCCWRMAAAAWQAPTYARQFLDILSDLPGEARLAGLELAAAALLEIEKPNTELQKKQAVRLVDCLMDPRQTTTAPVRGRAGRSLAALGDPRLGVLTVNAMPFCFVPSGLFIMGSEVDNEDGSGDERLQQQDDEEDGYEDEQPQHSVDVAGYWIGQYPVTNAQFDHFVQEGGYQKQEFWYEAQEHGYWKPEGFLGILLDTPCTYPASYGSPFDLPNHPVVGVSWYEALAFARWLNQRASMKGWLPAGWEMQLPSEAEWEKAARGGLEIPNRSLIHPVDQVKITQRGECISNTQPDRAYPWGNPFDAQVTNVEETGIRSTSAVGSFPAGASPYGCQDLSGNVWEWTRSLWEVDYPYDPGDQRREDLLAAPSNFRVLRGGSWLYDDWNARCAYRGKSGALAFNTSMGFRVVVRPSSHSGL
jgi:formylglycine-generating enzyme required for sulfatase activity